MRGLRRFLDGVDESQLKGCLRVVPIANLTAFWARSAFVVPVDGLNLNRFFPGDPGGSYTERLAHALFENAIRGADYHVDMHAGDVVEDLEPFTLYEASPVEERARALALAYGLANVVRTERSASPIAGTSSAAASEAGIPAITAEVGGRGIVDEHSVQLHYDGVRRVLSSLGVLSAAFDPVSDPAQYSRWVWLHAKGRGWWVPIVRVGQEVAAGSIIGTVTSIDDGSVEQIVATQTGVPLFITSSPSVVEGGLLLGLAAR